MPLGSQRGRQPFSPLRLGRLAAAAAALLAVESFEATNGFGVMRNVYDPLDFVANAAGVGLALTADLVLARLTARRNVRRRVAGGTPTS